LDVGSLLLFNYAYPLISWLGNVVFAFINSIVLLVVKVGSSGMFSDFRPAMTLVLVCAFDWCFYKLTCISLLVKVNSKMCPLTW
jgi:hypothetical protein